ncbi:MAG TPA: hypothetical protein VH061_12450 [Solirubrobacteraceae bacterium]|nr:hypothetical protein [Solirubrobacteraceae bacterium]
MTCVLSARLSIEHDELQSSLDLVLDIFSRDVHDRYLCATPTQRRFLNQAIFKAIWIFHEHVNRSQLTQPFDEIRVLAQARENAAKHQDTAQAATSGKAPVPKQATGALPEVRLVLLWWT